MSGDRVRGAKWRYACLGAVVAALTLVPFTERDSVHATEEGPLKITYPLDETIFPPEIVSPTFTWKDESGNADRWNLLVRFRDSDELLRFSSDAESWRPSKDDWEDIKGRSVGDAAELTIHGVDDAAPDTPTSSATVHFRTSEDPVGDSIFYREVTLPFLEAIRDPSRIRWRFGSIDSETAPPIVLQDLPVCGNCHSFSGNGSVLGLDVDFGNDKGAYAIMSVGRDMVMNESNIITWADYKKDDAELTFGLLSQVSPDGRYVVSTVKDRSVFIATPEIAFSQLFFPIKGILVIYDRETKEFRALPGADDPAYVQSNPTWSPDGKEIVFARSKVYELPSTVNQNTVLLDETDVPEFLDEKTVYRYDLYTVPFNEGKGGVAKPLAGASGNGMSNFFAKYSPDGKWIVFCQARSYMLLQPDSELYIVPAAGGVARRLTYNTALMNSWHSWSSNSRWLVFSSKVNTPYTQLFLTHIDEDGKDSPPVLLEHFTASDRAANIPEFVALGSDAITQIREEFLDAYSFLRAGTANERTGDYDGAMRQYQKGLELNPDSVDLHNAVGWAFFQQGNSAQAIVAYERALAIDPGFVKAHNNAALAQVEVGRLDKAAFHFRKSVEIEPTPAIYSDLGFVLYRQGKMGKAIDSYEKALALDPKSASAHFNLAVALVAKQKLDEAAGHYQEALRLAPDAKTHNGLGYVLASQGKLDEAAEQFRAAIRTDPKYTASYNNLAGVLAEQEKWEEAARFYAASLAQKPSAGVHNDLGVALQNLGRMDEAVEQFRKAILMDGEHVAARKNLAAAMEHLKP